MSEIELTAANEQPETPATESPAVEHSAPTLTDVFAADPTIAAEAAPTDVTTPTANATIEISNVSKGDINGQKRDKTAIDVILVRNRPQNRTAIVLDTKTMQKSEVPFVDGMAKNQRYGDSFVMEVKKSNQRPVYATLHLTLDDLADRIAALPDDVWQPRHKNRPSAED